MNLAQTLTERGLINQISGATLAEIIEGEKRTIYQGIDPSADSATIGNMAIWMLLRHLAEAGHKIVFLVGGGTGMIGDPKPDAERQLKDVAEVAENVRKIKVQAEKFFAGFSVEFVDNAEWLGELKLIDFLRNIGKHYTVNELIKKDAIATRLASDTGLSYTEFAYPLLQGYDYLQLFTTKGCTVQVGGSDQWGNIISGVELVRRKAQKEVYAITVPLVIDKVTGKKFGKSEGNAVWLAPEKTSPYQFYQFWLNVSDEGVVDYLKVYTMLSLEEIAGLEAEVKQNPGERAAQKALAAAVTTLVHGEVAAKLAVQVSAILFRGGNTDGYTDMEKSILLQEAPSAQCKDGDSVVSFLVRAGLAGSNREARQFIKDGAVRIDTRLVEQDDASFEQITGRIAVVTRGKKYKCIANGM